MSALLRAVEKRLRSAQVFNDRPTDAVGEFVSIQTDGNPPNNYGQFACVVHPLAATPDDTNAVLWSVMYSVGISVTARLNYAPKDRRGIRITNAGDLLDRAILVAQSLVQDDLHRIEANQLIPGTAEYVGIHGGTATVNGFLTPLKVLAIDPPRPAPAMWGGVSSPEATIVSTVRLGEAHRVQRFES